MLVFELTMIAAWFGFTGVWSCVWISASETHTGVSILGCVNHSTWKRYEIKEHTKFRRELNRLDHAASDLAILFRDKR